MERRDVMATPRAVGPGGASWRRSGGTPLWPRLWQPALLAMALATIAARPLSAFACTICYGDPDSSMTQGLTWGILTLVVVVGCVLAGVVAFFVHANRKAPVSPSQPGELPSKTAG